MPGVPSNKSCERCKKRHLKCDEARPSCQRCLSSGVQCPGYVKTRKFIDQGASVRRRYAPYQDRLAARTNDHAQDEAQEHAVNNTVPDWPSGQPVNPTVQSPGIRATESNTANHINQAEPTLESRSGSRSIGQSPITPVMGLGQRQHLTPNNTSSPSRGEQEEFQDIFSELMTGTEHEVAFLIRYFSDTLGPWFDLSDSTKFFSAYVPIRAIDDPFLKFAVAALAAKHLGRMKGARLSPGNGMFTSPSTMETYPNAAQVDWFLKAANYYYLAASHMNSCTSDGYTSISSSAVLESPIEIVNQYLTTHSQPESQPEPAGPFWRKTESLLASATILTMYKLIDEPGENWQQHLAGINQLFTTLLTLHTPNPKFTQGATAAFWNLARQDYLASYYTRIPPHFSQSDLPLWRAAGIPLRPDGTLSPTTSTTTTTLEDTAANTLIHLLNKLVHFLAHSKRSQWEQWTGQSTSSSPPTPTPPTTTTWLNLSLEFQSWFDRLPETFRPCLRLNSPKDPSKPPETVLPFPEIFYSLTSCAVAMQHYHFGRLALSLNRPADTISGPSTAFDRLQGYRDLMKEADYRCREICGIALGRPSSGARIYMVTLLFAVGQCLEGEGERAVVVDLLRGVRADLGWETGGQVGRLEGVWVQSRI